MTGLAWSQRLMHSCTAAARRPLLTVRSTSAARRPVLTVRSTSAARRQVATVRSAMLLEHIPRLCQKRIVLASASPRRKELLSQLGLKFEVGSPRRIWAGKVLCLLVAAHRALGPAHAFPLAFLC